MDKTQTREVTGEQMRARLRHHDIVGIVRHADLTDAERQLVLEYLGTANVHAAREELGGAQYLTRAAQQIPDHMGTLKATVGRLATCYVHPTLT